MENEKLYKAIYLSVIFFLLAVSALLAHINTQVPAQDDLHITPTDFIVAFNQPIESTAYHPDTIHVQNLTLLKGRSESTFNIDVEKYITLSGTVGKKDGKIKSLQVSLDKDALLSDPAKQQRALSFMTLLIHGIDPNISDKSLGALLRKTYSNNLEVDSVRKQSYYLNGKKYTVLPNTETLTYIIK